jgi:hypothetical protein
MSLPFMTGQHYRPVRMRRAVGRDPRLLAYLAALDAAIAGDNLDAVLHVLAVGMWRLDGQQARELAEVLKRLLRP